MCNSLPPHHVYLPRPTGHHAPSRDEPLLSRASQQMGETDFLEHLFCLYVMRFLHHTFCVSSSTLVLCYLSFAFSDSQILTNICLCSFPHHSHLKHFWNPATWEELCAHSVLILLHLVLPTAQ